MKFNIEVREVVGDVVKGAFKLEHEANSKAEACIEAMEWYRQIFDLKETDVKLTAAATIIR